MKEIEEILKFFFKYFKILKISSGSNVSKWTQSEVQNALKWSANCLEVVKRIKGKSFMRELLTKLKPVLSHWNLPEKYAETHDGLIDASKQMKRVILPI